MNIESTICQRDLRLRRHGCFADTALPIGGSHHDGKPIVRRSTKPSPSGKSGSGEFGSGGVWELTFQLDRLVPQRIDAHQILAPRQRNRGSRKFGNFDRHAYTAVHRLDAASRPNRIARCFGSGRPVTISVELPTSERSQLLTRALGFTKRGTVLAESRAPTWSRSITESSDRLLVDRLRA